MMAGNAPLQIYGVYLYPAEKYSKKQGEKLLFLFQLREYVQKKMPTGKCAEIKGKLNICFCRTHRVLVQQSIHVYLIVTPSNINQI